MTKCFRYLFQANLVNYPMAVGFGAVIIAGCYLTGVPADGRGLFYGYFNMFPSMLLLVALFSGTALCTSSLNHALSYGARREDYFWGLQGIMVLNTLVYTLMNACFLALPTLLGWNTDFQGAKLALTYPLSMFMVHAVGCALGRLYTKSQKLAMVINAIAIFLLILNPIFDTIVTHNAGHWGDLPWLLLLASLLITFVCEFWTYCVIKTATVR